MKFPFTKLGATIGPACNTTEIITSLVKAGMSFARLNFSHGTYDDHAKLIAHIREAAGESNRMVSIFQDLQGPKLRLGILPDVGVAVTEGEQVVFDTMSHEYTGGVIPLPFDKLERSLHADERLLIDDGTIECVVTKIEPGKIMAKITTGGVLKAHKGLNFPDSTLVAIPALSEKDKADVRFGLQQGVDIVSLSFVKRAQDVTELKLLIGKLQEELGLPKKYVPVVAKIERPEAMQNLEEIIQVADAIMVARGDLGLELPMAELPVEQKTIIAATRRHAKPVIVATQLLYTMEHNPRPTRAEVSDVANAVVDHVDALLLTNETATGEHPIKAVEVLRDVVAAIEASSFDDAERPEEVLVESSVNEVLSKVSEALAQSVDARIVLTYSGTGEVARFLSHHRLTVPIVVGTHQAFVMGYAALLGGVEAVLVDEPKSFEHFIADTFKRFIKEKRLQKGDKVIVVSGERIGDDLSKLVEVRQVE